MRSTESPLRLTAFVVACAVCGAAPAQGVHEKQAIVAELDAVGAKLVDAVRRRDATAILEYVAPYGLSCGDVVIPRDQVARDLLAKGARPNAYLFDAATFNAKFRDMYAAVSLAQEVEGQQEVQRRVVFAPGKSGEDLGSPCIEFGASEAKKRPWLCFIKTKKSRWVFIDSLYEC